MTPEEKAVIAAAIMERNDLGRMFARTELTLAVDALLARQAFLSDGETAIAREGLKRWDPDYPGCAPEECGGSQLDPCSTVMRTKGASHDGDDRQEWKPATFADLLPGDRARIGQEETTVTRASRGQWHVSKVQDGYRLSDGTHVEKWEPGAQRWYPGWEHEELRIDFTVNPGMKVYPPETACEILCDAERAAILTIQQAFPGTSSVVN